MGDAQIGLNTLRLEDSDDDFDYEEVEVMSEGGDEADEDLDAALRSLQAFTKRTQDSTVFQTPEIVPGQVTRKPEVIDDFLRNFFVKMSLTRTCEAFEAEWYELKATGQLDSNTQVPDVYLRNSELEEEVNSLHGEIQEARSIAMKASSTWDKFRKERDFHRMHHKRVAQEKNKLIADIKRLKDHYAKYEPTILELKRKYEAAMKEKMLVSIERDKLLSKVEALSAQSVSSAAMPMTRSFAPVRESSNSLSMTPAGSAANGATSSAGQTGGGAQVQPTQATSKPKTGWSTITGPQPKNPYEELEFVPAPVKMMTNQKTFKGHLLSVASLTMHPTKPILVTASDDKSWKMWHIPNGDLIMAGEGHKDWVAGVDFHPTGTSLASGGGDSTVKLWDFEKQRCSVTFSDHKQAVWSVKYHCLGDVLASSSLDHTVRLWDISVGKCRMTLRGHVDSVNEVFWMPYTINLATASSDKTVSVWDARSGLCVQTYYGHPNSCNSVVFNAVGTTLASTDSDGLVKLWDTRMVAEIMTLSTGKHPANKCCFDRSGNVLAVASDDGKIKTFNAISGELIVELTGHEDAVQAVIFNQTGKSLISCGSDNTFRIWQ